MHAATVQRKTILLTGLNQQNPVKPGSVFQDFQDCRWLTLGNNQLGRRVGFHIKKDDREHNSHS